jgi:hypothetical protein
MKNLTNFTIGDRVEVTASESDRTSGTGTVTHIGFSRLWVTFDGKPGERSALPEDATVIA